MKEIEQIDDEIDLKELALKIWNGKWFVVSFVIAVLLSISIYVSLVDEVFESEIIFERQVQISSLNNNNDNNATLKKFFYDTKNFEKWKDASKNQLISYQDLSESYIDIDSKLSYLKDQKNLEVYFREPKKKEKLSKFVIRSNDPKKIQAYQNYLDFLNSLIKKEILSDLNFKKDLISESQKKSQQGENFILGDSLDKQSRQIEFDMRKIQIEDVFQFTYPTTPKLIKPKKKIIFSIGAILGLILGVFMLLIRESLSSIRSSFVSDHKT